VIGFYIHLLFNDYVCLFIDFVYYFIILLNNMTIVIWAGWSVFQISLPITQMTVVIFYVLFYTWIHLNT
jgi:hypothetical protein